MVSGMSEKPSTENKSLEQVAKGAGSEDKAAEAPKADAKSDLPAQVVTETVLPEAGVTEYPQPEGDKVAFRFAHYLGKSRLDDADLTGEEYKPGDEVELDADVAESLARAGAGVVVQPAVEDAPSVDA